MSVHGFEIFSIGFNQKFYFNLHSQRMLIRLVGKNYYRERLDPSQKLVYAYTNLAQKLLPPPFPSECRDYHKEGFESQLHCIDYCVYSKVKIMGGKVPLELIHETNANYKLMMTNYSIRDKCKRSKCSQQSCHISNYDPYFLFGYNNESIIFERV